MHILAGSPGTAKTTVALSMAATITRGGTWPDGSKSPKGDVLIWSGEDDIDDTLLPRALACGCDPKRLHFVRDVGHRGRNRPFDPATDMNGLLDVAYEQPNLKLVIVEPMVSLVAGSSNSNSAVRKAYQPLITMAVERGCPLLGITHFNKAGKGTDPLDRVTGSLAFGGLARMVMCAAKPANLSLPNRLVRAKSNLCKSGDGFDYAIVHTHLDSDPIIETNCIEWGQAVFGSATDLLAEIEQPRRSDGRETKLDQAVTWMAAALADGSVPSAALWDAAEQAGISKATYRRARDVLGLVSEKGGFGDGWNIGLPN
ncbi:hypothetical protein WV31_18940 [Magnetospirillum sp. ME-1]|nr:hypothetical protein WV31_18940 [Magnetospirillum sp. ME-1]